MRTKSFQWLPLLVVISAILWIMCSAGVMAKLPPVTTNTLPQQPTLQVRVTQAQGVDLDKIIYFALLKLALEKSGRSYVLKAIYVPEIRPVMRMHTNPDLINVFWKGTSPAFEQEFLPVRIPLLHGLLGYRLFLIRKDSQAQFDQVKTVADLAHFRALLGRDWIDTEIYRANHLPVVASFYPNLIPMLAAGRGDYFSRSILEINQELNTDQYPEISIEQSLLLYYPLAMYFFVAPDNQALHDALYQGLEKAIADGSYNNLLATHPSTRDLFKTLHLSERRLLMIENPLLSEETRAVLAKYVINPQDISSLPGIGNNH
ncbi:hypothetical protein [Thiothrix eikelboomii]|uniref:hypothetical protein n=1 Tax=Thiothrix eikelboomii TaxID=92487 RepID=UPI003BB18D30